jgi:hypothetical protein
MRATRGGLFQTVKLLWYRAVQAARPDGGSRKGPYKFASDETPAFFEVAWMICATVWHALSLRPPAPAFEDREVQQ